MLCHDLQELYEMAQRKFLRQLSSYSDQLDPFPRLFVADLNYVPEEEDEEESKIAIDDLQAGQFCIKLLCEYEKVSDNLFKIITTVKDLYIVHFCATLNSHHYKVQQQIQT